MSRAEPLRVGYVVKRYRRYSENFIVNEILAHEAAGLQIEICSFRPPVDTHFQDVLARVRAPVNYLYLPGEGLTAPALTDALVKAAAFWNVLRDGSAQLPGFWAALE